MRKVWLRSTLVLVASLITATPLLWFNIVSASSLTGRSVRIRSSSPGATTNHLFSFTFPSTTSIGSLSFEYCSNSPQIGAPCVAPVGLDASGVVLDSQTGEVGFSKDGSSTANRIVLTRLPGLTSAIPATYNFSNIINQSTPNSTAYVRIASYSSSDGTGATVDDGAVAYSTASPLNVSGFVPPYLSFCVGVVVAIDCSNATGTRLNFGELSTKEPRYLSSQFSVATNDPTGYVTSVIGTTMTSGNNVIPALAVPLPSQAGVSQFGMNLRANSVPPIGANPAGIGTGVVASNYANPNHFFFKNGAMASSPLPSNYTAFTVSYIVNVNQTQPPGIYTTTLTYVASVAF